MKKPIFKTWANNIKRSICMTLNKKAIPSSMLIGLVLVSSQGYTGTMGSTIPSPGKVYVGVFGGAGASNDVGIAQFGTAFFSEAEGGPLAVNAFGTARSGTIGLVGGQIGYQWPAIPLNLFNSFSGITPAAELEGYYLGKNSFTGHELNNDTTRLPEHDILVTSPINTGVFLVNAVATFNLASQPMFQPYIGAGIGAGVLSITNADSAQVAPAEADVNHYNSNTSSSDAAFAAQVKAGLNVYLSPNIELFGEYRWLYLSSTDYTFGSTVYPTHAPTSSWLVTFDSQNYNLGAVGLRYTI